MKKKLLAVIMALAMMMTLMPATAFAAADGSGTSNDPYTVSSASDFSEALFMLS